MHQIFEVGELPCLPSLCDCLGANESERGRQQTLAFNRLECNCNEEMRSEGFLQQQTFPGSKSVASEEPSELREDLLISMLKTVSLFWVLSNVSM